MKKVIVFTVLLLLTTINFTESSEKIKILVDESRVDIAEEPEQWMIDLLESFGFEYTEPDDPRYSFDNTEESFGFGAVAKELRTQFFVNIKKSGKLSYDSLKNYDVLIICSIQKSYSSAEVEALRKFVENGGGLLFCAHYSAENNSVSRPFGVLFHSDEVYIHDNDSKSPSQWLLCLNDFAPHPITEGITQILLDRGIPLVSYEEGDILASTSETSWLYNSATGDSSLRDEDMGFGPFSVLLVQSVGEGRTVFFGSRGSFYNSTMEEPDQQNMDFFINMVTWLGEHGGPYKQYVTRNQQGQQMVSEGKALFENHAFSQAKLKFRNAVNLFTESNDIYPNPEAEEGIKEAEQFIEKCETGMNADAVFKEATELFNQQELENALETFEDAQVLYEDIQFTEQIEVCKSRIEEIHTLIAARKEALTLLNEAEEALETAPSTFNAQGYERARSLFEQSRSKWEQYNDPEQVTYCEDKMRFCENEIAAIKKTRLLLVGATGGAAVAGFAVVMVIKRSKSGSKT